LQPDSIDAGDSAPQREQGQVCAQPVRHPAGAFPADTTRVGEVLATETMRAVQQRTGVSELLEPTIAIDPIEHASLILMARYNIDRLSRIHC
jgi:hypothetical protein